MKLDVQNVLWLFDSRFLSLLACLVLVAISVRLVSYYRALKREEEEEPITDEELLAEFQAARDAGEMDEDEFQRVSQVFLQRSGQKAAGGLPTSASGAEPPQPAQGEGTPATTPEWGSEPSSPQTP